MYEKWALNSVLYTVIRCFGYVTKIKFRILTSAAKTMGVALQANNYVKNDKVIISVLFKERQTILSVPGCILKYVAL